ncbi:MAG TPA: hypothetical protein VNU01_04200 [Egibacteraceae bacterium]|nr:hypothetical protein [Egibacteraceae bacterium]
MKTRFRPEVPAPLAASLAGAFGGLSWLRHARVFHPRGVAFRGTLRRTGLDPGTGSAFLDEPGEQLALVRFSKGAGLPDPLPDVLGIAVRALDADGPGRHRDLLFASSAAPPVLRHLLVPARRLASRPCSSVLPYATPAGTVMLAAAAEDGPSVDRMAAGAAPAAVRLLAATTTGPWRTWAVLLPEHRLSAAEHAELAFDPWNAGVDLRPSGLLNRLRHPAYAASRAARPGGGR